MDRREYPRFAISCPVDFSVDVMGAQFLVERFSSSGTVIDISRNGLLAEVDRLVAVGTECVLSLVDAEGFVCPDTVRGTVRRSGTANPGWRIAVQFDQPLDLLSQRSPSTGLPGGSQLRGQSG